MDKDIFFSIENIETNLLILLRENPDNKIAFEYLMAYYLLNKRLDDFINALPNIKNLDYKELPLSYQEAVILYMSYTHINPLEGSNFTINDKVISKFRGYTKIFRSNNTRRQHLLHEKYSGTYWYYFHYNKDVIPNTASLSNP